MKIYIQRNTHNAWKWIGSGYAHAFVYLDHPVIFIDDLSEIQEKKDYKIFCREDMVNELNLHISVRSTKPFSKPLGKSSFLAMLYK
jgi:3'-phosphoadenosine 5'-phosphosulfate sulfotransferase (PAPS reductase)/FAD synthetase